MQLRVKFLIIIFPGLAGENDEVGRTVGGERFLYFPKVVGLPASIISDLWINKGLHFVVLAQSSSAQEHKSDLFKKM